MPGKNFTIRLLDTTREKIEMVAAMRYQSMNSLIQNVMSDYCDKVIQEQLAAKKRRAVKRLNSQSKNQSQ